jgi:hypothetical protein
MIKGLVKRIILSVHLTYRIGKLLFNSGYFFSLPIVKKIMIEPIQTLFSFSLTMPMSEERLCEAYKNSDGNPLKLSGSPQSSGWIGLAY